MHVQPALAQSAERRAPSRPGRWIPDALPAAIAGHLEPQIALGLLLLAGAAVVGVLTGGPLRDMDWPIVPLVLGGVILVSSSVGRRRMRLQAECEAVLRTRIDAVMAIAERLTRTLDRQEILDTIVTEVNRTLHADATTIRVLENGALRVAAWAGISDELAARLPVFRPDEGWFGETLRSGRPWVRDDIRPERDQPDPYASFAGIFEFASDMAIPLVHDGRVIGALSPTSIAPRHWTHGDVEFVTALATYASIALHNAELFERTEQRAAQLDVLRAASARMSRENTVETVGRAIVEETGRIIDYHNARVYLLEGSDDVVPVAFEGRVGAYEKVDFELLRTKLGEGFTGWVAEHGTSLLVNDTKNDPRGAVIPGTDEVDESMLVVPMLYDERVTGVITLSKLGLNQFDDEDRRLLAILADQAATAMETARLVGRTQALAAELRRLLDMSSELSQSLDPRAVADLIAKHMAIAVGTDECTISYWDRAGDRLLTWGHYPPERRGILEPEYPLDGFPETRRVLFDQVAVHVEADDPGADAAELELLRREGSRSLVMLPLVAKGQSIGIVEMTTRTQLRLDAARLEFARTMANEAAMALENAKLYEEARALADHDPLTGFFNHRYLHERLGEEVVRAGRSRRPVSLLMIDLDDFKLVNDTFGHLFGDRVLAWVAERIRSTLRVTDVAARYGGDEFAVILPDSDHAAAVHAGERIVAAFQAEAFQAEGRGPVPIGVSVGVATHPGDGRTAQELISAADGALYRGKRSGGCRIETVQSVAPAPARTPARTGGR